MIRKVSIGFFLFIFFSKFCLCQQVLVSEWSYLPKLLKISLDIPQQSTRPVVVGDFLFTADVTGTVSAFHRIEGYLLWQTKLEGGVVGALSYGRSKIFVGDVKGNLYALNARDGSESWRFKIQAEWVSPPSVYRDKVLAATSNDELYALSETRGFEVWHYAHRGDEKMTVRGTASPAIYSDQVFMGFSDGNLVALSLKDGKQLWIKKLKSKERFYDVDTTPAVDERGVVAASFDGKAYSLDRASGDIQWVFPVGAYSGALLEGDRVYLAGLDGHLYALNRQTSAVIWKSDRIEGVGLSPTWAGEYLVVTTSSDPVVVIDPKTGKTVFQESLGAGTLAAASGSADGWFYCMSNYNNLRSFRLMDFLIKRGLETVSSPTAVMRDFGKSENNRTAS